MDTHMKEDAWGVLGLLGEGERVVRRSGITVSKGRAWSRQVEVQGGKGDQERAALVNPSVMTLNKSYFTLDLEMLDFSFFFERHLCGGNGDLLAGRC